jgi:hypothetical protein
MKAAALLLALCLTGCASLSTETRVEEAAWQALNVVDTAQTVQIAQHPDRYWETGTMRPFTGRHPSTGEALGWMAAFAVGHYAITNALQDHPTLQRFWEAVTLGSKAYVVIGNHSLGIQFNHCNDDSTPARPPRPVGR